MELIHHSIEYFLHLNTHIATLIEAYGDFSYVLLFIVIFSETGLVVFPWLPGDSLLFAVGTVAAQGSLNIHTLVIWLSIAAILGNFTNYLLGRWLGKKLFCKDDARIFKKSLLDKTHAFYQYHGGKAIIIGRFIPLFRTFVPFVAGMGKMPIWRFSFFNIVGGILWVSLLLYVSYLFGSIAFIKNHFVTIVLGIVFITLILIVYSYVKSRRKKHALKTT